MRRDWARSGNRASTRATLAGALTALILALTGHTVAAQDANSTERARPVFGPKLLYYPLECQSPRGCRIECFQNGKSIVTRSGINLQDELRLVVNAGVSDEIMPRWIEIKRFSENDIDTLLLASDVFCNLSSLSITPVHTPP